MIISDKGVSTPTILPEKPRITAGIYVEKCLKPKLMKFINKYHNEEKHKVLFWPDKASVHYANDTLKYLDSTGIDYVAYGENPTNLPQARPIEHVWSRLKQEVFARGSTFDNLKSLERRIKYCVKTIDWQPYMNSMLDVQSKIRVVSRKGGKALLKC